MPASADPYQQSIAGSVRHIARKTRTRTHATKLIKLLADKQQILITTHQHPDPDALASTLGMAKLLRTKLPNATISLAVKGLIKGGINEMFVRQSKFDATPWDDAGLANYDAILLLDAQPAFGTSPLPPGILPIAVIDHHRSKGEHTDCPFCDIRKDVGATTSIVFSYFLELDVQIDGELAALMLYAIESDLAGAAGTPSELDNVALSSLTLLADTRKLYQMRYFDLPQSYFNAYFAGIANATIYDWATISHLGEIDSVEKPALIADALLRLETMKWSLVTATYEGKILLSVRMRDPRGSAADMMKQLVRNLGSGGGHRTKAGGSVPLQTGQPRESERIRHLIKQRFLRRLGLASVKPKPLVARI